MLKDITLGQYYRADSVIHRLDPRVKLFATIIYIIEVFLVRNWSGWILVTAYVLIAIALSKVPFKLMLKGVKAIWVLVMITAICNLFFNHQDDIIWSWKFMSVSQSGIHNAIFYSLRLVFLVIGSSVMTLTTTPNKLTDGLETALRVLGKIGVPIHEIAMMMSIALRFIPILSEEAEKIKKAQMARGARFDEGTLIDKAKSLMPLLVPLFVSAFRRANDLALAMEARCYRGSEGRTRMYPLKYSKTDLIAYVVVILSIVPVILLWKVNF